MAEDRVVVVSVGDRGAALSLLDGWRHDTAGIGVRAAAVVHRDDRGELQVSDRIGEERPTFRESTGPHDTARGLIGVLAASVDAIFLGNAMTAMLGAVSPGPDPAAVVELLARSLPAGGTALVALVAEDRPAAVEAASGGAVVDSWPEERLRGALDGSPDPGRQ